MQAERAQQLGLQVEHLVEELLGLVKLRRGPGEELDLGELVHAVQALGVAAPAAGLGAVAARGRDALEGKVGSVEDGVGFHARERNLGRAGKAELGFPPGDVLGRLGDGVDLGLAVGVARLEAAGACDVGVDHARRAHLPPAGAGSGSEGVVDQGLFELGGFVKEIVPPPSRGGGGAGKVEDAELCADVCVRTPDAV